MKGTMKKHIVVVKNSEVRNAMTALRQLGWSYERIAVAFDLSPKGHGRAVQRIIDGTAYHRDASA